MKFWEKIIEKLIINKTAISRNQFGVIPGRCTI